MQIQYLNWIKGVGSTISPFKILLSNHIFRYNLIFVSLLWLIGCLMNHIVNYYIKYIKTRSNLFLKFNFNCILKLFVKYPKTESIFAIFIISGTADIISKGIYTTMMKYLPFKEGTWVLTLMAIISAIWYTLFSFNTSLIITLIFCWKLFAGTTFASTFYASNTMFESKVSTTAFGIANISGKIGASLAPMMAELPGVYPMMLFAASGWVAIWSIGWMKVPQLAQEDIWEDKKNS